MLSSKYKAILEVLYRAHRIVHVHFIVHKETIFMIILGVQKLKNLERTLL